MTDPNGTLCGCRSYRPGHNCHQIQAGLANSDPTSWFAATVTELTGGEATVEYEDHCTARVWRHGGFDKRVAVGTTVLVCERWSLVSVAGQNGRSQLSVEVRQPSWRQAGLPDDRPQSRKAGIVNLETGEGIDILHGDG